MDDKIKELKKIENAYQVALDWYYREKLTEDEYNNKIGEWKNMEPNEIVDEMCKIIKSL